MITDELIFLEQDILTQDEVFDFLAQESVVHGKTHDKGAVKEAFIAREHEGTTGMLEGFAIPHAKSSAIDQPAVIVVKLKNAIEWQSLDGSPTQNIFALLIPENDAGEKHLSLLSKIAKLLMNEDFKHQFKQAQNKAMIAELLRKNL